MKRKFFAYFIGLVLIPVWSCSHNGIKNDLQSEKNRVTQLNDGSVLLKLDNAVCYSDAANPGDNTAEWQIVISKPGQFRVWLSSATRDTTNLDYANSVRISLLDNQLKADPSCDRIIRNPVEFPSAYFRADSYMGSFFVSDPGEYIIQVISEKVIARNTAIRNTTYAPADDTMLMSVILTPKTR